MTTLIKPLDEDVQEFLDIFVKQIYLDGSCYELAVALHRGLGWELIGLIDNDEVRHAAVRHPEGGFFDGRGWVSETDFRIPFDNKGEIVPFKLEHELKHRTRLIIESNIIMAGKLAMSRWPELPWQKDTYFRKVISFLDGLEELSREHGFWLYGNFPSQWPALAIGEGDEVGYALATTGNGTYTINRVLKND